MTDITQYAPQVERAIAKFAAHKTYADKEDYRQECYLALIQAEKIDGDGYAYTIAKNKIIDLLRSEPEETFALADEEVVQLPDAFEKLASAELLEQIEKLPEKERTAIKLLFGIEGEPKSMEYVAAVLLTTPSYVRYLRDLALDKLRNLL